MTPTPKLVDSWLGILWALVVLQGGILALSVVEILVMNAFTGFLLFGNLLLTVAAATAALTAARGLRRRKTWARRLTLIAEWFILIFATVDAIVTTALSGGPPDLIPVLTGLVIPVTVLVFLRKTKPSFSRKVENTKVTIEQHGDHPVLGTVV